MKSILHQGKVYADMMLRWGRILGGGYYHTLQEVGPRFAPDRLAGYYSDLRHKTDWAGAADADGIPLNRQLDGELVYFAITIFQKGIGHWEHLLAGDSTHEQAFLQIADWAVEEQDEQGGWPMPPVWQRGLAVPYSAMAQGEGVSLLLRAHADTGATRYLDAARRALKLLLRPVAQDGTYREIPSGVVFEEYPCRPPNTVLNGWVFALYGLHDFLLVEAHPEAKRVLASSLDALEKSLRDFNAGYWSYYDTDCNLASPFYQHLHVAQLDALYRTFPDRTELARWRDRFGRQLENPFGKSRAVVVKALQKLRRPPQSLLQ